MIPLRKTAAAGAALVMLSLPTGTSALPHRKERWITFAGPRFEFFSNATRERTLLIARNLERFDHALSRISDRLAHGSALPTSVYIFKSDASFTPYKTRQGGQPRRVAAYFMGRRDGNYIAMNADPGIDPLDVIYREYIHHFVDSNLPKAPLWFHEGLAECYSTFRAGRRTAQFGKPILRHIITLRYYPLMPLEELFAVTSDAARAEETRTEIFYAQSWALVHYLLWGRPERRDQLIRFLERIGRGEEAGPAFVDSFGTDHDTLEAELRSYVEQERFPYSSLSYEDDPERAAGETAFMTRDGILCRLGDLLAHLGPDSWNDADAHYRKALRADGKNARAHAGLGWLERHRGRSDGAIAHFEKAVSLEPDDFLINYHFGEALLHRFASGEPRPGGPTVTPREDVERARALFAKSIATKPDFGEAYVGYAETMLMADAGDLAPAIRLFEAGRSLLPARADIVAGLAILYERNGDSDRADHLVEEILTGMADPDALEAARRALSTMREGAASPAADGRR